VLVPVAAITLAIAVSAAVVVALRPSPRKATAAHHGHAARPAVTAPGHIVVALPSAYIGVTTASGASPTPLPGLGRYGSGLAVALDNRYLTTGGGQLVTIGSGAALGFAGIMGNSLMASSPLDPFADHDTRLVLLEEPSGHPTSRNRIWLGVIPHEPQRYAGTGDAVAGDPAADGVFASVAAVRRPARQSTGPDSSVELRDAGRPAVVLATAAELNADLGRKQGAPVVLTPYPSPAGDRVAVTVSPLSGSKTSGIVVLNRTGKVLARRLVPQGPLIGAVPAWSQSGHSLAYAATGTGPAVRIWTIGGASLTEAVPGSAARYNTCMWSPDGHWVLCDAGRILSQNAWAIGPAAGGSMKPLHAPGFALAWLP
jgi:hypothetical protein